MEEMIDALREFSSILIKKEDDRIFSIAINYFNDGECVDVGARVVVCDVAEENFSDGYYSFIIDNKEFGDCILSYLKEEGAENEYLRLKKLAQNIKENLIDCNWLDCRANIYVQEYD